MLRSQVLTDAQASGSWLNNFLLMAPTFMRTLVRWAVQNTPGMNVLMCALLFIGAVCLMGMRREEFPEFELEQILISVPYPGASPEEVEEGICLKIEEAVRSVDGIKKQTSIAAEGMANVMLELSTSVDDVQRVLNEIRSEVDRIPSFPELAEDPEIQQITMRSTAIRVTVLGPETDDPEAELKLRSVAEDVRDEILHLPSVTQAKLLGVRDYQIDVEISESTLREYGLTLTQVGDILRRENLELPGGLLKAESERILLRARNKHVTGEQIAQIPLVTQPNGVVLTVADLGTVRDEFTDTVAISRVDGKPGMVISVDKTSSEDLMTVVREVRGKLPDINMPPGYRLEPWKDASIAVQDRMDLLSKNGIQGLLLVFLMLGIFLEIRLAFWVAMGIPISVLGACIFLLFGGQTLNMLSMFAFLMALGIVVDDAIVIGENIYAHREQGKPYMQAAIDGTVEVFPSVLGSVLTSIIAFLPLMFVSGMMGKFIGVLPVTIIAMLAISLFESIFILPAHLSHQDGALFRIMGLAMYPLMPVLWLFKWLNQTSARILHRFVETVYVPLVEFLIRYPAIIVSSAVAVLIVSVGFVQSGLLPFVIFPKLDRNDIQAKITFPNGTPAAVTSAATEELEAAIRRVVDGYRTPAGDPILNIVYRTVGTAESNPMGPQDQSSGSHIGSVTVELVDTAERPVLSSELQALWREEAGAFAGTESLIFSSISHGPGGKPIEFKIVASTDHVDQLDAAVEECKERLKEYPGVYDVTDDSTPGKFEFQIRIKERARAMGISLGQLGETVRASYYGAEVMRLQRGRHEVKLMVRYPADERSSLRNFDEIRVRTADGSEVPITELADIKVTRGVTELNRINQLRSITISADVDESNPNANAADTVASLKKDFVPELFDRHPGIRIRWEGQEEERRESMMSLIKGLAVALVGMYILLVLQFRSYVQPILIMLIIPFGCIGAIFGHFCLGLPVSMFSMFGFVALTGVVVNDSIVLIDFINQRLEAGFDLHDAVIAAGRRRFRPVLLTSVTTVAGLTPILLERSLQAQYLIPMAASLSFGIMTSTVLVLILVPSFYCIFDVLLGISPTPRDEDADRTQEPEPVATGV